MNEVIRFALLDSASARSYAFASQGLIVIFRGTGVLNFSLGATAIAGVYMQWELQYEQGLPFLLAALIGVALSAALGALTHWVIMRPLQRASSLIRVIATLGVLVTIQAGVVIRYGSNARQVDSWLPTDRVTLWSDVSITVDRLILLGISCLSALLLWLLFRSSRFGLETEAVSESERSAAAVGISPNRIAVLNWALGSAIASIAGILVIPIIRLEPTAMTSLVLAASPQRWSATSGRSRSPLRPASRWVSVRPSWAGTPTKPVSTNRCRSSSSSCSSSSEAGRCRCATTSSRSSRWSATAACPGTGWCLGPASSCS